VTQYCNQTKVLEANSEQQYLVWETASQSTK